MRTIALFALSVVLFSGCLYNDEDYDQPGIEVFNSLTDTIDKNTVPADGKSTMKLTYKLPISVDTALTRLTLKCSNGKFQESGTNELTVNVSQLTDTKEHRYTDVILVASGIAGPCIITTGISVYERKKTVEFSFAPATSISLSAQPFYINNDTVHEIALTCNLKSAGDGIASLGHDVQFSATQGVGFFKNTQVKSDASGQASTIFVYTNRNHIQPIEFNAWILNTGLDTAEAIVQVID